jgi:putative ABC transport system permease protein
MRARFRGLGLRVAALIQRRRHDQDLQDEIAFHVAMREAQLRDTGLPNAAHSARRRFGSVSRIREEMRDAWAVAPRLTSVLQDCRYAARALRRSPAFTAVVVLTLALGIGANTAVFSIVNAVLLRPLGFSEADRLLLLYEGVPGAGISRVPFSPSDLRDVRRDARSFDALSWFNGDAAELSGGGSDAERIRIARVSAGLFPMLGIAPQFGRLFSNKEDTPGHDLALISWELWARRYGTDSAVLGTAILLDRRPYTVIGVMPPGLQFPRRGPQFNSDPADVWIPAAIGDTQTAYGGGFNLGVIARLSSNTTLTQARAELEVLAAQIQERYPVALRSRSKAALQISASPLRDEIVGDVAFPLIMLLGAIVLVLLVACANVANLLLSRVAARQHEIGLRVALGASRLRLLQFQLAEPLLLSLAGGALGLALARVAIRAVPKAVATQVPGLDGAGLDPRVLAFTVGTSLLTAMIVAVVPFVAARCWGRAVPGRRDGGVIACRVRWW